MIKLDDSAPECQQLINLEAIQCMLIKSQLVDKLWAWIEALPPIPSPTHFLAITSATAIMAFPWAIVSNKPFQLMFIQAQPMMQLHLPTHSMTVDANNLWPTESIQWCMPLLPCLLFSMLIQALDHLCTTLNNWLKITEPLMEELTTLIPVLSTFVNTLTPACLLQKPRCEFPECLTSCKNYMQLRRSFPALFCTTTSNNHKHEIHLCWHVTLATSPVLAQNCRPLY